MIHYADSSKEVAVSSATASPFEADFYVVDVATSIAGDANHTQALEFESQKKVNNTEGITFCLFVAGSVVVIVC